MKRILFAAMLLVGVASMTLLLKSSLEIITSQKTQTDARD
jgi:hypothetical protein